MTVPGAPDPMAQEVADRLAQLPATTRLIVMIGLPGAGKTRLATALSAITPAIVISPDAIRRELSEEADQSRNDEVFAIAHEGLVDALDAGRTVIWDATCATPLDRERLLRASRRARVAPDALAVYLRVSFRTAQRRNAARARPVPEQAITRMFKALRPVTAQTLSDEGFTQVTILDSAPQ